MLKKISLIIFVPHLLVLLILAASILILYKYVGRLKSFNSIFILIVCFSIPLHILFAATGSFFRYESYLVALGLIAISLGISEYFRKFELKKIEKKHVPIYLLIFFVMFLPFVHTGYSVLFVPQASANIHEQQYQMALFIKDNYNNGSVGLNDIGAVNFLSDINCLDLYGLANKDVARMKRENLYGSNEISAITAKNNVKVVIIYKSWFRDQIPPSWVEVGEWIIENNLVCGDERVTFYATDMESETDLIEKLRNFSPQLPKNIKESGKYLETN